MAVTTIVHVRVDEALEAQAADVLATMGLSVSDAVRLLLRRIVIEQAWPLELKVPNAETRQAMVEARAAAVARFESADLHFDGLDETRRCKG